MHEKSLPLGDEYMKNINPDTQVGENTVTLTHLCLHGFRTHCIDLQQFLKYLL